ncbi:hypothetical protein QUA41_31315 [Microcoleus sp. Pol11C1]|uniref:hypothetical protein n=1 Tax=unclassified Microcoleus TaxID=2642155 RepID=UPI002FD29C76
MSQIQITAYSDSYERCGCKFTADSNQILVVAEYWEAANEEANKKPLDGFGSNTVGKFTAMSQDAITQAMAEKYGQAVAVTGVSLLDIPVVVMRFSLS